MYNTWAKIIEGLIICNIPFDVIKEVNIRVGNQTFSVKTQQEFDQIIDDLVQIKNIKEKLLGIDIIFNTRRLKKKVSQKVNKVLEAFY